MATCYFIRKKSNADIYWNSRDGWTDRAHADLHGHLSLTSPAIQVPPDGVWVDSYYGSLEEHYDQQEDAGIAVDPGVRPRFPARDTDRHTPQYSLEQFLKGDVVIGD